MLQRHRGGGRLVALGRQQAHADAAEIRDPHAEFHRNAAHRAPHHDALAIELNLSDFPVRSAILRGEPHGQGEGVEPQRAARPGRGVNHTHI